MKKLAYMTPLLQVEVIQLEQGIAAGSVGGESARVPGTAGSMFESQVEGGEQTEEFTFPY